MPDVIRRRAAAPAENVDEAFLRPRFHSVRGLVRLLVILAHLVGQARIGISRNQRIRDARHLGDERPHQIRAQRAIEADRKRLRVLHRIPERFRRLARKRASGAISDRPRNPDRQMLQTLRLQIHDRLDGSFGIQRVGDGLDQVEINAAFVERFHLVAIGVVDLVEVDEARSRIVHVG